MSKLIKYEKLLFILVVTTTSLFAQDETVQGLKKDAERTIQKDPNDTTVKTWKTGGFVGLNAAQGSLSNWAAGGDKVFVGYKW